MFLQYKSSENTVGKWEIAQKAISPFPTIFSTLLENFLPYSSNIKLPSAKSLNLEESKLCLLVKHQYICKQVSTHVRFRPHSIHTWLTSLLCTIDWSPASINRAGSILSTTTDRSCCAISRWVWGWQDWLAWANWWCITLSIRLRRSRQPKCT